MGVYHDARHTDFGGLGLEGASTLKEAVIFTSITKTLVTSAMCNSRATTASLFLCVSTVFHYA